jgi:hypothetical protein
VVAGRRALVLGDERLAQDYVLGLDGELAAAQHGVACVDREVDQDLLEVAGIDAREPEVLGRDGGQLDVGAEQSAQHLVSGQDVLVDADDAWLGDLVARERE